MGTPCLVMVIRLSVFHLLEQPREVGLGLISSRLQPSVRFEAIASEWRREANEHGEVADVERGQLQPLGLRRGRDQVIAETNPRV